MTNTPMTSREAFEKFDKEHFGKKDMPINYETWECPTLGTRYVDAFVQTRYAYYQACEQQNQAVIAELREQVNDSNNNLSLMANDANKSIAKRDETIAELVEALESLKEMQIVEQEEIIAKALAKVKGK